MANVLPRFCQTAFQTAFLAVVLACGTGRAAAEEVRIAVAANFLTTAEQLAAAFKAGTGNDVTLIAGSTGKLYAQIVNGAPVDIFLAADATRPALLAEEGRASAPTTYALGRLALWRPGAADAAIGSLREADRIAVANPDLAPYGAAAIAAIRNAGLEAVIADRLVYGENIGQAFAFVKSGAADAGFVAYAQILALPLEARGAYELIDGDAHAEIRQDAVLLYGCQRNNAAVAFMAFLTGPDAAAIIRDAGYDIP